MSYQHLTYEERHTISTLRRNGSKPAQIAQQLGRAMGTKVKSGDLIADALANKIVNRMEAKTEANLAAAEKEIEGVPLTELLGRKKSYQIPIYETGAVTCKINTNLPYRLIILATGLKLKLVGPPDAGLAFQKIADAFA